MFVNRLTQKSQPSFIKSKWEKKSLDFGGNPWHVTSGWLSDVPQLFTVYGGTQIHIFFFFSSVGLVKFYFVSSVCCFSFFLHKFMLPIGEIRRNIITFISHKMQIQY